MVGVVVVYLVTLALVRLGLGIDLFDTDIGHEITGIGGMRVQ